MTKVDKKETIYGIIGIILMFSGWFISPVEPITEVGMQLLGIFAGLVWLWTFNGMLCPVFWIRKFTKKKSRKYASSAQTQPMPISRVTACAGLINDNNYKKQVSCRYLLFCNFKQNVWKKRKK